MVQIGPGATYTIAGIVGTMAEDGPAVSPVPFVYMCSQPGWWPDPEYVVRTADARALAADLRQIVNRIDSKRADLRAASAGRRRGRRVRSAEARRGDAQLVCERRARPGRHRPLQPVHAGRLGSDARDCGQARDRRIPGRDDPADRCGGRATAGRRHRARHRPDRRRRSCAAWRAVRRHARSMPERWPHPPRSLPRSRWPPWPRRRSARRAWRQPTRSVATEPPSNAPWAITGRRKPQ